MAKYFILSGSIAAFLGVALGAFGAHGLREQLSEKMMAVWQTGVQYHLIHAVALILVGILFHLFSGTGALKWAGYLFVLGIILFSGSLYLLAVLEIRKLGMITPLGGLSFLAGWLCVTYAAMNFKL
jgi:uncharacterized membrane protein YgdD (TMEM256/DUF423 family)